MITANLAVQIVCVLGQYKKKSLAGKLKEVLITLLFLRPVVDAYRVSTNHEDVGATIDSLMEMTFNKGIETATKNIPGCVLQLYVWCQCDHDRLHERHDRVRYGRRRHSPQGPDDSLRWDAAFTNRSSFTKSVYKEIRTWVASNIAHWQLEKTPFFKIEMIPSDFLPSEVLAAEGGAARKNSAVIVRELVGVGVRHQQDGSSRRVSPIE